jgi:hypothetical protein
MESRMSPPKSLSDPNQLAKAIIDIATGHAGDALSAKVIF